jgi:hypothetical protein
MALNLAFCQINSCRRFKLNYSYWYPTGIYSGIRYNGRGVIAGFTILMPMHILLR